MFESQRPQTFSRQGMIASPQIFSMMSKYSANKYLSVRGIFGAELVKDLLTTLLRSVHTQLIIKEKSN